MSRSIKQQIHKALTGVDLTEFEVIKLQTPASFSHYQDWLQSHHHAKMTYMERSVEVRQKPQQHFENMKSLIVFKQDYFPAPHQQKITLDKLKVAHYARDKDYHFWFREKLNTIIKGLQKSFPDDSFLAFTDAVPLLERDHAAQGALGWIGKNTCLIHPKQGSLFFIGEILTSLEHSDPLPPPMHDFCGTCTACIDACPTDALSKPKVLDANRCIAYWNIESRDIAPVAIREKMSGWFFGCDICQTVCPWNIKIHKEHQDYPETTAQRHETEEQLRFVLESSNKKLLKSLKDTPLTRAGGRGLKRNALIVIANLRLRNLQDCVEKFTKDDKLGELAEWTLLKLNGPVTNA